jgi:hypothetical protein
MDSETMKVFLFALGIYCFGCVSALLYFILGRSPFLDEHNLKWPVVFFWPLLVFWPPFALADTLIKWIIRKRR